MVRKSVCLLSVVVFTLSFLCVASCTKQVVEDEGDVEAVGVEQEEMQGLKGEGITEEELEAARRKVAELRKKESIKIANIYFAFDDFSLSEKAKKTLVEDAAWLMNNPQETVVIEGHCDERGTEEYNIALGERRANSAKKYLINLGVKPRQLSTISYGEEKPADPGHDEDAWAKNRRDEFVVQ